MPDTLPCLPPGANRNPVAEGRRVARLIVLQPDARVAARLSSALRAEHDVRVVHSWDEAHAAVADGEVHVCVVDADHPTRDAAKREIAAFCHRHPSVATVAFADASVDPDYYLLGGLGVDGLILANQGEGDIRDTVTRAIRGALAREVLRRLGGPPTGFAAKVLRWALEHGGSEAGADDMAIALDMSPATLQRMLRQEGLPSAGRLLLWGRILMAAHHLSRDHRGVEATAYRVGYSSAAAFARAARQLTGMSPSQMSAPEGFQRVLDAFVRELRGGGSHSSPRRFVLLLTALLLLPGCGALGVGGPAVDRGAIREVLETPPLDQVHFGVLAVELTSGRELYARNRHKKFVPASNQKLLVSAAALSLLGPGYRYRTEAWAAGSRVGPTLDGDLVVVARGDPTLSERFWPSGEDALYAMADSLWWRGLRHVTGSVVIDVSAWDSTTVGPTWEVEDLRYAYGATGGAFAIDEGTVRVVVRAGPAVGTPAEVTWRPDGDHDYLTSFVTTSPSDSVRRVTADYLPESRKLELRGHVPLGSVDTLRFAIRDPVRRAAVAFGHALDARGVQVDGTVQVAWEEGMRVSRGCAAGAIPGCPNAGLVFTLESPPTSEIVQAILEVSQNWMAEQVLRTLGAEAGERGSWPEGRRVLLGFLTDTLGIDSLDVAPRDGSGLSAYNLVTPRAVVRLLRAMRLGPHGTIFRDALAEPGEDESTLEERLLDLRGRVWAKTGTISNVNSLSGFLVRDDGREIVFSILSNGSGLPAGRVREGIDDIVRALAGR